MNPFQRANTGNAKESRQISRLSETQIWFIIWIFDAEWATENPLDGNIIAYIPIP